MAQATGAAISARLAAAQEQLQQRRRQRRQERQDQRLPILTDARGRLTSPHPSANNQPPFEPPAPDAGLPASLGWESEALTQALHQACRQRKAAAQRCAGEDLHWLPRPPQPPAATEPATQTARACHAQEQLPRTVLLFPEIAIAMLRQNVEAAGRIWLLLRHLDVQGRGWIEASIARRRLTAKKSPLRVCGWRQLRNLLAQGDGLFWQRDNGPASEARIWLRSTAKVAAALGVPRLSARAINLDVSVLLDSIGSVRAHFYASYHRGRRHKRPISRQCLEDLTGVARRSQHKYEAEAGIERRQNWAVGARYTQEAAQERAWRQGNGVFQFTDHQGKTGAAGATYVAWQLPNSYLGPHEQQVTSSRKRINRQLVDLFTKGITGNGKKRAVDQGHEYPVASFYEHGHAAARAYNRSPEKDLYWQSTTTFRHLRVWHILPARETMP
ncbi:MAG TPA: hypothetical protein VK879_14755 [Candidatus Sulfomarinibacteraceae bacterium]|nr:hypothetical protein [Candidatus Sulfomarinibacteraceae bacterium]